MAAGVEVGQTAGAGRDESNPVASRHNEQRAGPARETSKHHAFQCYAFADGELYRAVCLDLSLNVQKPTIREAVDELNQLVRTYVEDAAELGAFDQLVPRRAPLRAEFRIYLKLWRLMIWQLARDAVAQVLGRREKEREPVFLAHPCFG